MKVRKLDYGESIVIAKKAKTSSSYVRTVLLRARQGKTIYGPMAKKIVKLLN